MGSITEMGFLGGDAPQLSGPEKCAGCFPSGRRVVWALNGAV